jgi:hypothetical protein
MKYILDAATILGGIAAVWFFAQQFASRRNRTQENALHQPPEMVDITSQIYPISVYNEARYGPRSANYMHSQRPTAPIGRTLISASFIGLSGVISEAGYFLFDLVAGMWVSIGGLFFFAGLCTWIFSKTGYEDLTEPTSIAGIFAIVWCIVGVVVAAILNSSNGGSFPIKISPLQIAVVSPSGLIRPSLTSGFAQISLPVAAGQQSTPTPPSVAACYCARSSTYLCVRRRDSLAPSFNSSTSTCQLLTTRCFAGALVTSTSHSPRHLQSRSSIWSSMQPASKSLAKASGKSALTVRITAAPGASSISAWMPTLSRSLLPLSAPAAWLILACCRVNSSRSRPASSASMAMAHTTRANATAPFINAVRGPSFRHAAAQPCGKRNISEIAIAICAASRSTA